MTITFSDIVDGIRSLPLKAKFELREVLDHELIEARRMEMNASHDETMEEWRRGELHPTSDVNEIMRRLNEE